MFKASSYPVAMDQLAIKAVLPHRDPFLWIDAIATIDAAKKEIVGVSHFSSTCTLYQGHFPQHPITPGVLVLEAMAQTGGVLIHLNGYHKIAMLLSVEKAKFRVAVPPGSTLFHHITILRLSAHGGRVQAVSWREGVKVAEAQLGFGFMEADV